MNDSIYGLGAGVVIVGVIVFYLGVMALCLWIGYLLMRTAVKNGTIQAHEEMDRRASTLARHRERDEAQNSAERALAEIRANRASTQAR